MKKAFTLAETMITMMIIGVVSAIVIPVLINSKPNEKLLKFKKANEELYQVINTLITSDKYYLGGDLGVKPDGTQIIDNGITTPYFCNTFADVLTTAKVNCVRTTGYSARTGDRLLDNKLVYDVANGVNKYTGTVTEESILGAKTYFDTRCKTAAKIIGAEIITKDGITYYNGSLITFGDTYNADPTKLRHFSPPGQNPANYADKNGFDIAYKIFCMDVDGIPDDATQNNCKNECPFGYGIRADGKILPGVRATEWLEKEVVER